MPKNQDGARSRPTQKRAQESVDKLVEAATRVLAEFGYEGASTNRIAEYADVGIATLYRYFKDKDDLVDAVFQRQVADTEALASGVIVSALNDTLDGALRTILRTAVETMERNAPLYRVFTGGASRHMKAPDHFLATTQSRLLTMGRIAVMHILGLPDGPQTDAIAFLGAAATSSLAITIALERPPELDRDELIDHGVRMLALWLASYSPP